MKNIIIVLLSFICLSSCQMFEGQKDVSPEFAKYIDYYIEQASIRGIDFNPDNKIYTVELVRNIQHSQGSVNGTAKRTKHRIIISVEANFWENASEESKQLLILHEAGHGFLNYDHEQGKIMGTNPSKYIDFLYDEFKLLMLNEFFQAEPIY